MNDASGSREATEHSETVHLGKQPRAWLEGLSTETGPLRVEVVGGPMDGLRKSVDTILLTIGRGENNDLVLPIDPRVSHHHAGVSRHDDGYWLSDLGSTNGTFLGDRQVRDRIAIEPGTIITVGGTYIEFMPR